MATLRRGVDSVCTVPTVLTIGASQTNGVPRFKTWDPPPGAPGRSPLPALLLRVSSLGALAFVPRALCLSAPGWLPPNGPLIFASALSFLGCLVRGTCSTYRHSTVSGLNEGRKVPPALRSRLSGSSHPVVRVSFWGRPLSLCSRSCLALDRSPSSPSSHHQHTLSCHPAQHQHHQLHDDTSIRRFRRSLR